MIILTSHFIILIEEILSDKRYVIDKSPNWVLPRHDRTQLCMLYLMFLIVSDFIQKRGTQQNGHI